MSSHPDLDDLSDEELGQLLRHASKQRQLHKREQVTNFEAFCSWLDLVGLGWIASTLKVATWAWQRIKDIVQSIFD